MKKGNFFAKYKWHFIVAIMLMILIYCVIYLCFVGKGFLSVGLDLEKKDWLSFLGAYLAFSGSFIVSMIAIFQGQFFVEEQKKRDFLIRLKGLQPIFSIEISNIDSAVDRVADWFNPSDSGTYPKHKNVTIKIENVGEKPIRNVIIFDKYLFQLMKPNEPKVIQIAYSDSPDIEKNKSHLIEVMESEYERSERGIPKWFNIVYDDIDGNGMFQTFNLCSFDGTDHYSLGKIETVENILDLK